jgi:protocatechuate 3,4-dioxygenase, beta subunit
MNAILPYHRHCPSSKFLILLSVILFSLFLVSTSCRAQTKPLASTAPVGGGCDGCKGMYDNMPPQLDWQTTIASAAEPGERMEISGVIYQVDGKTPAPNVILYVYHTDAKGIYSPAPGAISGARIHGHLRGWVKTNQRGEYRFTSIRPAHYPNARGPAHIHAIVKEPDKNEYWIDEYLFDDDPALKREPPPKIENHGGSGIIHLTKNSDGIWLGRRDITLGLNIPNYR